MAKNYKSCEVPQNLQGMQQLADSSETEHSQFRLRVCFPEYQSVENELRKAGLLRVVVGIIVSARFLEILHGHHMLATVSTDLFVNAKIQIFFLALLTFTLGFCTQISTVVLLGLLPYVDSFFLTSTLGSTVLSGLLVVFLLLNSGRYYSVDAFMNSSNRLLFNLPRAFLGFVGADNLREVRLAYFVGVISYGACSYAALQLHLIDYSWQQGLTVKSLLTNAYLCKYYNFFRALDVAYPSLLSAISIIASIGQTVFQYLMIPLMFLTLGRWFVFLWGMGFFFISLICINLSYLPHIELVLWALIFCPSGWNRHRQVSVFYDDRCNLCRGTVRILNWLNYNSAIRLLPLSMSKDTYRQYGFTDEQAQREMVGVLKGRPLCGYNLYCAIASVNILLWPLIPFLWIGKIAGLGEIIYRYVAERRRAILGVCQNSSGSSQVKALVGEYLLLKTLFRRLICVTVACCFLMLPVVTSPGLIKLAELVAVTPNQINHVRKYLRYLGFAAPNVFNHGDLAMGDTWMELYLFDNSQWKLVPFRGREGERLNYQGFDILNFTNHNSDKLYYGYGGTLRFGRARLRGKNQVESIMNGSLGKSTVESRILYDYNYIARKGERRYRVIVRSNNSSRVAHWDPKLERYEAKVLFQQEYTYSRQGGLRVANMRHAVSR